MASGREIKTKIKSTQNMRKVTRALEMVSASKIRKAQDLMKASRPYARAMRKVIAHVAQASTDFNHPFLIEREKIARVGYIVVIDRPRPLRRPELQPVPSAAAGDPGMAGQGRRGRRRGDRPEGRAVLPPHQGREPHRQRHAPWRKAEGRAADRRDQGRAGRLHGEWRWIACSLPTTTSSTP